jgi:hypothetical protein
MNILIGKIGRSIFWNPKEWDYYSGDEEAPLLFRMLATRHPEHTFYMISRNYADIPGRMPPNVIDLFDGCPIERWANASQHRDSTAHFWLMDQIKSKNLKFDVGIFYLGPSSCISVPGVGSKTIGGDEARSLQILQNYGAPIIHTLNETQTPYFLLCGDPRYIPWRARDVFNDESVILSQINCDVMIPKRANAYADQVFHPHRLKYRYGAIETVFMLNEKRVDFRNIDKDIEFTIFLNGKGSFSADREKFLEEWVLSGHDNTKIYGAWNYDFTEKWPDRIEDIGLRYLTDKAFRTRYTMIPPFTKSRSNFVTQKFWKMIYYGIIPFFHPMYDTSHIFEVPTILRPKSAQEMWTTIEHLNSNPEERYKVLEYLWNLLDPGYFNGDHLHDVMNKTIGNIIGTDLDGFTCRMDEWPEMPLLQEERETRKAAGKTAVKPMSTSALLDAFFKQLMGEGIAMYDARKYARDRGLDLEKLDSYQLNHLSKEISEANRDGAFA